MRASLHGCLRRLTRANLRAGTFWLCFAIPAVLTAVYATLLSREAAAWQTAMAYWLLTLLLIWLIGRLAAMIGRCEDEAVQEGRPARPPAEASRNDGRERPTPGVQNRLAHLEQIVVRQHRFVADAAHELRTPLTALSLTGENVLAKKADTGPELRAAIASMLEESEHMKRLIEGLLDLTRASLASATNQEDASRERPALDLGELARDCTETLQILAEEKRQSIEVDGAGPLWVNADLTLVRQAVLNVMHNAIQHCPEGARIRVATASCLPDQGMIRVQDNGPGISLEEQHNVFERFYRGSGGIGGVRGPARRGLGLGLSIAKAILCSQGGGIELRSRPGAGSCFILTLPLMPESPPRRGPARHSPQFEHDDLQRLPRVPC
jgi:signal transduction histidine kinase